MYVPAPARGVLGYVLNRYGDATAMELREVPIPVAGVGEVLIRVHAAGLNPVDYKMRQGKVRLVTRLELPTVAGSELSGVMGRHKDRTDLGREFGATDVVPERGEEGMEKVRELTGGDGTHTVLECVGLKPAIETAFGVVRDGGVVSRAGAPQYPDVPADFGVFMRNITLTCGVAPPGPTSTNCCPTCSTARSNRSRVRPHHRPGGGSRRLPRHGQPSGTEGAHPPLTAMLSR